MLYYEIVYSMEEMQTKIIKKYKKISDFVFHYLIFFVALVLALLIFQRITSQPIPNTAFQTNDNLLAQRTQLIAEFNKSLKQDTKNNDLQIHILQWDFQTEQWFIKSVNNLVSYKWFIVPRYFYIYNTIPIQQADYFSGGNYDISELENFVNNFVFTQKITITTSFTRVQLPLSKTLIDDFNLSCLFETKFSKNTCNYYLNDFLDSFFVYNLSIDYPGLTKIFDAIKQTPPLKQRFCEWLSKYLLYANDQNDSIKELFGVCGQTYSDVFKRTSLFVEIQKTLENQSFDKISYKDMMLNEYKLLSYQQQIYQDFLINKVDTYKISTYLDFVKDVIQKDTIGAFYKDEIYRYNNKYLFLVLEKTAYQSNIFSQNIWGSKIASLLTMITTVNEWEPLLAFWGLNNELQNTSLIPQMAMDTWANAIISQTEKIQQKLQNLSYLILEEQNISGSNIDIIWYLKFLSPDKNETIKSHIVIEYVNDMLIIKRIELQNKPGINDVLKNLLLIQDFSIGELYSYISKNLVFYEQENAPINTNTDLCPALQNLQNITFISCTPTAAILEKDTLQYEFTFKNGGIENIYISDKTLENSIKSSYSTIVGNHYTLIDIIQAIVNHQAPTQTHEGTTNAIVVFEKIQKYLGITPNDIADRSWTILVDISLGWINFIVNYIFKTSTLDPWYFKDILVNTKPYLIQNLNLTLDDAHQKSIHSFVGDPLTAIKNADFTARQNYNEFIK